MLVIAKPAGPRRAPGRGPRRRHARQRPARALPGDRRTSATRRGPASCTGSTATRAACSWSPARQRAYDGLVAHAGARTRSSATTSRSCGATSTRPRGDRRADRTLGPPPAPAWRSARAAAPPAPPTRSCERVPASRSCRCSRARSRPVARTRSGCTSRRSATPWWATPSYGGARPGLDLGRPFLHATAAGVRAPGHRGAHRGGGAAPARARRASSTTV